MPKRRLLISNALIADIDAGTAFAGSILVEDGRIAEVHHGELPVGDGTERREAGEYLVIPGLVNAHTHGHGSLGKGLGDLWTLELLLNASIWTGGVPNYEDIQTGAMLNAAEMIRKGCTAAYDLFAQIPEPDPEALAAVAAGYGEAGMRVVLAPMMADRSFYESVPGLLAALPGEAVETIRKRPAVAHGDQLARLRKWLHEWRFDRDMISPALAPTIPTHCTREFLEGCRDLVLEHGARMQMHLAESKPQALAGIERFGKTLTAHLHDLGLLGPHFTGAHCIWLDDDDLLRMAESGAQIAHNPGSNLRLGSGIAPARQMMDRGIPVGIGTDGSVSSDNQNMFEAIRLAAYVSRARSPDPGDWISAPEALRMATAGGAEALGFAGRIGRIEPGYFADLVFLDLANINFVPLNDAVRQVVQCEDSSAVSAVMIAGRFVLDNGEFTGFDYEALRLRAIAAAERLKESARVNRRFADSIAAIVERHCVGLARRPYHVERYCGC